MSPNATNTIKGESNSRLRDIEYDWDVGYLICDTIKNASERKSEQDNAKKASDKLEKETLRAAKELEKERRSSSLNVESLCFTIQTFFDNRRYPRRTKIRS